MDSGKSCPSDIGQKKSEILRESVELLKNNFEGLRFHQNDVCEIISISQLVTV